MKNIVILSFCVLFATSCFSSDSTPTAPYLTAQVKQQNVTLEWSDVDNADSYKLYYAPAPYSGPNTIGSFDMQDRTGISVDLNEGDSFLQ